LAGLTRHFIEQVRYEGIGGLEFKRDRRAGRIVIVEPTVGRTDWQSEIATLCGINIPLTVYWRTAHRSLRRSINVDRLASRPGSPRMERWHKVKADFGRSSSSRTTMDDL
jgi:predicted ATP-grasp superfamily ATP-dependent carboligase